MVYKQEFSNRASPKVLLLTELTRALYNTLNRHPKNFFFLSRSHRRAHKPAFFCCLPLSLFCAFCLFDQAYHSPYHGNCSIISNQRNLLLRGFSHISQRDCAGTNSDSFFSCLTWQRKCSVFLFGETLLGTVHKPHQGMERGGLAQRDLVSCEVRSDDVS